MEIYTRNWSFAASQGDWTTHDNSPATAGWASGELYGELASGAFDRTVHLRWTGTFADLGVPQEAENITRVRASFFKSQEMENRGIAGSTSLDINSTNLIPVYRETERGNSYLRTGDWVNFTGNVNDTITLELPIRLETGSQNPAVNRYIYVAIQSLTIDVEYFVPEVERYEKQATLQTATVLNSLQQTKRLTSDNLNSAVSINQIVTTKKSSESTSVQSEYSLEVNYNVRFPQIRTFVKYFTEDEWGIRQIQYYDGERWVTRPIKRYSGDLWIK